MRWQIRTSYDRWLAKDDQGFYTTQRAKALVFEDHVEAEQALEKAQAQLSWLPLELAETP